MPRPLPGYIPDSIPFRELEISNAKMRQVEETLPDGCDDCDVLEFYYRRESYRDEQEAVLLVRRDPHQVRPPADTGVEYGRSEADQTYHLSLNDPPERAEYGWNSVRLNDTCHLCRACRDVFNYYCRYIEAREKVGDSVETLSLRKTELKSI